MIYLLIFPYEISRFPKFQNQRFFKIYDFLKNQKFQIFKMFSIIKIPNVRIDLKMKIQQLQTFTKEHRRSRQNRIENHQENLARNQDQNHGFPKISFLLDGDPPPQPAAFRGFSLMRLKMFAHIYVFQQVSYLFDRFPKLLQLTFYTY